MLSPTLPSSRFARLKSFTNTLCWLLSPIHFMERHYSANQGQFHLDVAGWGRLVFLTDRTQIQQVFKAPPSEFSGGDANRILEPVVGSQSVFVLEGERHLQCRKAIKPLLSPNSIQMLSPGLAEITANWHRNLPKSGPAFDIHLRHLTMRLMTYSIWMSDDQPFALQAEKELAPLLGFWAGVLAFLPVLQSDFGPGAPIRFFKRRLDRMQELLASKLRRSKIANGPFGSKSDEDVLNEQVLSILIAGYDTTAAAIAWSLHWVYQNPAVLGRLREEFVSLSPDDPNFSKALLSSEFLDATCDEALRIVPVVDFYPRRDRQADPNHRDTFVAPCSYIAHRDPALFDSPDQFRPDRFIEDSQKKKMILPYGGGRRRCPGAELSRFLTKLCLFFLVRDEGFSINLSSSRAVRRNVVLMPKSMQFARRLAPQKAPVLSDD